MSKSSQEKLSLRSDSAVEKKHKLARGGLALLLAGTVLTGAGCSGDRVGAQAPEVKPSTTTESVAEPVEAPEESKLFMVDFGDRYEDPISTYYACEGAKISHGNDFLVTDGYLKSYAESRANRYQDGTPSELGFRPYAFSAGEAVDANTSIEIFNNYTSKQLELYMNLLSKNPTQAGVSAIDKQFMDNCSDTKFDTIPDKSFHEDDQEIQAMMEIAKSVVEKYGSAANYTVQTAEFRTSDDTKSNFDPAMFTSNFIDTKYGASTSLVFAQSSADIVIAVDFYTGENVSRIYHTISGVNIIYMTQPIEHEVYGSTTSSLSIGLTSNN